MVKKHLVNILLATLAFVLLLSLVFLLAWLILDYPDLMTVLLWVVIGALLWYLVYRMVRAVRENM